MAQITPDFSQASDDTPVPPGVYSARVTGSEIKTSQAGNDYISWKLQLYGAEGELAPVNNRVVFHTTMISGKGAGILKSFQKACLGNAIEGAFDTDQLLGKEVQVTLTQGLMPDGAVSPWPNVKAVKALQ